MFIVSKEKEKMKWKEEIDISNIPLIWKQFM